MTSNPLPSVQVMEISKKEIHKQLFMKKMEDLDEGKTGTNHTVMIPVPDVDKGKIDQNQLPAIIMAISDSGLYQLGTR